MNYPLENSDFTFSLYYTFPKSEETHSFYKLLTRVVDEFYSTRCVEKYILKLDGNQEFLE